MARYGKVLLQRLTFQYCDRMGCSQGMREYLEQQLPAFAKRQPHVEVATVIKRNRFPLVEAEYAVLPHNEAHMKRQLRQEAESTLTQASNNYAQQANSNTCIATKTAAGASQRRSNVIGVKHQDAKGIADIVWWLSQSQGRSTQKRIPMKHVDGHRRSIQGQWTASMFAVQ
eukprot:GHRR01005451.1.p1 GENE.GHRR01005451.1~~GHRR01005451.1.p1  ORF type:complete len:171 (+),score=37.79 GHRR01005451.1:332-844(+)